MNYYHIRILLLNFLLSMTAISVVTTRAHFFVHLKFIKLRNLLLKLNSSKEEARVG